MKYPKVQKMLDWITQSEQERLPFENSWDVTLNFIRGQQRITTISSKIVGGQDQFQPRKPKTNKPTINQLLDIYRTTGAIMGVQMPGIAVAPSVGDIESIIKSKSGEFLLSHWWNEKDLDEKGSILVDHLMTLGTAALYEYYDPVTEDVEMKVAWGYDLVFEPQVSNAADSRWVAIRTFHTKGELVKTYPEAEKEIREVGFANESSWDSTRPRSQPDNRVSMYDIYWRDGRRALFVETGYLWQSEEKDVKRAPKEFPVQVMYWTKLHDSVWGLGMFHAALEVQWLYNAQFGQLMANSRMMANPVWIAPRNSGLTEGTFTTRPGQMLLYNANSRPPQQIASAPMPAYFFEGLSRTKAEVGDVVGIHSGTLGRRQPGSTTKVGLDAQFTRDTTQLGKTLDHIQKNFARMFKVVLSLMKLHYPEKKMLRILNPSTGRLVFETIKMTDIEDDPDIFIQTDSLFKVTAAARREETLQLLQAGAIDPQTAVKQMNYRTDQVDIIRNVRNMAHAGDLLEAAKTQVLAPDPLTGELKLTGLGVKIYATDDLPTILEVWGDFMQTSEYYDLPPERQAYIADVFAAVGTFGMPPEAYLAAQLKQLVFPKSVGAAAGPQQVGMMAAATNSPVSQAQQMDQASSIQQRTDNIGEIANSMQGSAEANLGVTRGGLR